MVAAATTLASALTECGACKEPLAPGLRCTGCRQVAFCSKKCQQRHWLAGHKHECKKLKLAAKRAAAAAAAGADGASAADEAVCEASSASSGAAVPTAAQQKQATVSNSELPLPKALLMSDAEYRELLDGLPAGRPARPCGLSNVGNTCFANSLLQCLLATPALAATLLSLRHSQAGCTVKGFCLACQLEHLAAAAYAAKPGGVVSPKPLLQHIRKIARLMTFGRQEDAHELLIQLLDGLEKAELGQAEGGPARYTTHDRSTGVVGRTFNTWVRASVECQHGHVSNTYDTQVALPLDISAATSTLEDALRAFATPERLVGDNAYRCDTCKAHVAAERRVLLELAPNTLVLCLKRYQASRFARSGKVHAQVKFGEELDLSPFLAPGALDLAAGAPPRYSLFGVVVHSGRGAEFGHYIAYTKVGGQWWLCNDSSVSKVAATHVLSSSAYLLFYQREGLRDVPRKPMSREAAAAAAEQQEQQGKEGEAAEEAAAAGRRESVASGEGVQTAQDEGAQRLQEQQARAKPERGLAAAAAQQEQQEAPPASPMLRVETAPAGITALANGHGWQRQQAGSSGSPSAASSGSEEEDVTELSASQPLHASVSESNLPAAAAGDGVAAANGLAAEQQRQSVAAWEAGSRDVDSASGSESGGSSDSEDDESNGLRPALNPFDLLAADGEEEEDEAGSRSRSRSREEDSHANGSDSGNEGGQQLEDAVVAAEAAGKNGKAASKVAASGIAQGIAALKV